jgi:outer membrane protein OmpA-like peptidoglycan-associated protein
MQLATQGCGGRFSQMPDNQLKLDIPSDISFDSGSFDLKSSLRPILEAVAIDDFSE